MTAPAISDMGALAAARVLATNQVTEQFFASRADDIARTCQAMAARFQIGGRLLVAGDDAQRSDVAHVVVEFLHPVVVGKRALPAIALPDVHSGAAVKAFSVLGGDNDIVMVLSAQALSPACRALVSAAQARGMYSIVMSGSDRAPTNANQRFVVESTDACMVQETHEVLYHVLWELVHVFLDHRAGGPS